MTWKGWKLPSSSYFQDARYEALAEHHSPSASELSNDEESKSDISLHPHAYHNLTATRTSRLWLLVELLISALCGAFITAIGLQLFHKNAISNGPHVKEFAPEMPLTTINFTNRAEWFDRPSPETDAVWDSLTPYNNGWVLIPNPEEYNLQPGIPVPELGVERFAISMYHSLHCLQFIRKDYWRLVDAIDLGTPAEARALMEKQVKFKHVHHCLSYLVQAIQCSADLSIEWADVEEAGERTQTSGLGMPHHQCKDPKAVRDWLDSVHSPTNATSRHGH